MSAYDFRPHSNMTYTEMLANARRGVENRRQEVDEELAHFDEKAALVRSLTEKFPGLSDHLLVHLYERDELIRDNVGSLAQDFDLPKLEKTWCVFIQYDNDCFESWICTKGFDTDKELHDYLLDMYRKRSEGKIYGIARNGCMVDYKIDLKLNFSFTEKV